MSLYRKLTISISPFLFLSVQLIILDVRLKSHLSKSCSN